MDGSETSGEERSLFFFFFLRCGQLFVFKHLRIMRSFYYSNCDYSSIVLVGLGSEMAIVALCLGTYSICKPHGILSGF
jgi:hypothetical protein